MSFVRAFASSERSSSLICATNSSRCRAISASPLAISSRTICDVKRSCFSRFQVPPIARELLPRGLQEVACRARNDVTRYGAFDVDAHLQTP